MSCPLCHCPCFPSTYNCIIQYAPELRPIAIQKFNALIERVKLSFLLPLLGPQCLQDLCAAIQEARNQAANNTPPNNDYQQLLPQKWKIILTSHDFQQAYALAIYLEFITFHNHTITNDGTVQIYREQANNQQTIDSSTKHISREQQKALQQYLAERVSQAQQLLVDLVIKPNNQLYQDCQIKCAPCAPCNTDTCNTKGVLPYQKAKKRFFA